MGNTVYTSTMSVGVRHEAADERYRVTLLNMRLAQLEEEFKDLNFMAGGFDEDDFHEDVVYTTEQRMIPTKAGGPLGHITIFPGHKIFRDFAEEHDIPYRETPPHDHPDHPHNTPRPS